MNEAVSKCVSIGGPFYEDLVRGVVFDTAPSVTLTVGHAAVHQAVLGDRLRLALDQGLTERVLGSSGSALAHPGLVSDIAIGQSTVVTGRVIANLFYRGLVLLAPVRIGDTLTTLTAVVAMRDNRVRPGHDATGMAVLHITTTNQRGELVLDFHRCAMLPLRPGRQPPGHADDLDGIGVGIADERIDTALVLFDFNRYRGEVPGYHGDRLALGMRFVTDTGDTVSGAPELARLTLNLAGAHADPTVTGHGKRLVYGGHTIGIACMHLTRALPNLVTIAGWHSCDHLAPVFEGDVLYSDIAIERITARGRATLVDVTVRTSALRGDDLQGERIDVLDWRLVGVMA